ncbi:MAG TPA: AAA family ATPase [Thermoanaerobaculia bacterium]|nr:AAA family ATPase [Thermoanaerobaculia bacterium]
MSERFELPAGDLFRSSAAERLAFSTTAELEPATPAALQERAVAALELAAALGRRGFHAFALGPRGRGRRQVVDEVLERAAASRPPSSDLLFATDFDDPARPRPLRLATGRGRAFAADVADLARALDDGGGGDAGGEAAASERFAELRRSWAGEADALAWLEAAEAEVERRPRGDLRRRLSVHVVVDRGGEAAAPVVHEENPTPERLLGRIGYRAGDDGLVSDLSTIRAGSLHRADGGFLVVDAARLVAQRRAWGGLKRALQAGEHAIEIAQHAATVPPPLEPRLEPRPVPLRVTVVLVGSRGLYYRLLSQDAVFADLFRVAADFEDYVERTDDGERLYARVVAGAAARTGLAPFTAGAVARLIERAAREQGDAERLTTDVSFLDELMVEAAHYAGVDERETVGGSDVLRAAAERSARMDRAERKVRSAVLRGRVTIESSGERVGQVNALALLTLGGRSFGRPNRVTASVRMGKGEVVDVEREVKLAGPVHSKGVMILSAFVSARYAAERTSSLAASLVFEQSYGGIDGDSASLAELVALLSAIAGVPVRQGIAVTGSVDQHGAVQAVGGVDAKVEGFFDVCAERGLTGYQGVVLPRSNVASLMLDRRVVEAVAAGRFHVWAVDGVDAAVEVLTGLPAGERDDDGDYPPDSLNRRVADRIAELADKRRTTAAAKPKAATPEEPDRSGGDDEPENGGGDGNDDLPPPDPTPPDEPPAGTS